MVRHGSGPERAIRTGVGPVPVRRPKVRDPGAGEPARLASAIPPRRARRTRSLDALLPVPCPHGVSTGDFQEALAALLGRDAPNLSPSVIGRLKTDWEAEHERWRQRDLSARRTVHVWADGVHLQARMGEADGPNAAERMLVLIGATPEGKKELVGFQAGVRESARDAGASCSSSSRPAAWPPRPRSPRATAPWASGGRSKRCSPAPVTNAAGRKAANVLDKVPRSVQPGMKAALREADVVHAPREGGPRLVPAPCGYRLLEPAVGARPRAASRSDRIGHVFAEGGVGLAELISVRAPSIARAEPAALDKRMWRWSCDDGHRHLMLSPHHLSAVLHPTGDPSWPSHRPQTTAS